MDALFCSKPEQASFFSSPAHGEDRQELLPQGEFWLSGSLFTSVLPSTTLNHLVGYLRNEWERILRTGSQFRTPGLVFKIAYLETGTSWPQGHLLESEATLEESPAQED